MFISRVLVGDFTKGSSDYRRPPSKDGGGINFYDSCVNDVMDPSIFVVFEKQQIYPEKSSRYNTPICLPPCLTRGGERANQTEEKNSGIY
uniref:PARP catalytic domain-containing protein n=1 Tax=Pundamilia nyererei TaxID=303518 RepID=A0A3B4G1Q7_9CICH